MKLPIWLMLIGYVLTSGCSRFSFVDYKIEFDESNNNLQYTVLTMMPTESRDVNYTISLDKEQSKDMVISFKDLPESIKSYVSILSYGTSTYGEPRTEFNVRFETNNTPAGFYYVHIYTKSKEGLYREIIQQIHVQGFSVDALEGKTFMANDTLCNAPFNSAMVNKITSYNFTVASKSGGADNEFVISKIGTHYGGAIFTFVEASLDEQTGVLTIPAQNLLGDMVSGQGQLVFSPEHVNKYKGTILYYYQHGATQYEGKVTF